MDRTRNAVNRLVLLTGGTLLLTLGAAVVARDGIGTGWLPPSWTAFGGRSRWIGPGLWADWRTVQCLCVLVVPLSGGVLYLQLRRRAVRRLLLSAPGTALSTRALTAAVAARLEALPRVSSVLATLHRAPRGLSLRTRLVLDDTASPRRLLEALTAAALPEARTFLTPQLLEAEVRFTVSGRHGRFGSVGPPVARWLRPRGSGTRSGRR